LPALSFRAHAWEKITVRNHFRRGARFIADARQHYRPLSGKEKARILRSAEALERRTRPPGARNGVVSQIGLRVLRALLFDFHRASDGMCCPSYLDIMAATGLCKQSVAKGLKALEACGVLDITRRLVRRLKEIGGVLIEACEQASNLYLIRDPDKRADELPIAMPRVRPFPRPGIAAYLRLLGLGASLRHREKPTPSFNFGADTAKEMRSAFGT
jgi:hypothetical protein